MLGAEVRLLGPVELWSGGAAVELGPARQRTVLAALAVDAGRLVPLDTLIDRVWGEEPPSGVRSGIYSYVSRLRRVLRPLAAPGADVQLRIRPGGYLLDIRPESVDLHQFRLLTQATRPDPAAPPDVSLLGKALALWRGPAMADLAGPWVDATRERLEQQRVDAVLAWAQGHLRAGRPGAVTGTLRDFMTRHPLVEPLAAQLIEALYRSGRAAEALDCYARVRAHLVAELGTEPGPELRQLHHVVLRGDGQQPVQPSQARPATARGPDTGTGTGALPAQQGAFTGRSSELRQITGAARDGHVLVIHAIAGMPGVGKTALAVHAAHQLAGQFPDGQVFVDLHGHTSGREPTSAADVLATLLSADGADPRQLPSGTDARSALWRDRLAGRRMLLVLDNAASSAQVAPLLPASPGCLVLVTSRRFLGDLPGDAMAVPLDVLPPAEAGQMFLRLAPRAAAAPGPVADLMAACGFLPLAISLLARVLTRHRSWTVGDLLAETQARLLNITAEHASVAAAFSLSYQQLPADHQRMFRLLAVHPGTGIEPWAAAALAGLPVAKASEFLDALHADSLLIEVGYHRYVMHDLIRWYAGTLASAGERDTALGRLLDFYQCAGALAAARLARQTRPAQRGTGPAAWSHGGLPDLASAGRALSWARMERGGLLACLASTGDPRRVVSLTAGLAELLRRDGPWTEAIALHAAAVQAAGQLGDRLEQANALTDLGTVHRLAGDYHEAEQELRQAMDFYRELGSHLGQANALTDLGKTLTRTGRYAHAIQAGQQALDLYRELDDLPGQASALVEVGVAVGMTGDYGGALEALRQALVHYRQLGDTAGQAYALRMSGIGYCRTGEYAGALQALGSALELYRELGNQAGQALTLTDMGQVAADTGDYPEATRTLRMALPLLRARDHRIGQAIALVYLGRAARRARDLPVAGQALREALALYRDLGNCSGKPAALNEMGALHRLRGDLDQAAGCHRRGLELARQVDSRWDEAHALAGLGRCALDGGRGQDASGQLRQALGIFQHVGAAQTAEAAEVTAELATLC